MAITPTVLQGGVVLTTSAVVMYTVPANTHAVIKRGVFSNITAGAVTITVTITRLSGSAINIITVQPISADSTYTAPELANLVMNPGDVISALCSAGTSVNCFLSGFTL